MVKKPDFYGWKLVAALYSLDFLNMGFPLYGGAVIHTYMVKEIAMSRSTFGLGFTLLNLFIGVPSIVVAAVILRWGIKVTFGIGSTLILLGAVWLSFFATRPWHYLVSFGILIGTGISFGTIVPAATIVTRWFKRYRGRAMAITLGASGAAGFVAAPFINRVLAANGGNWRQAWQVVAGIAVLSALIAFLFVKERPEDLGQLVDGLPEEALGAHASAQNALVTKHPWTPWEAYQTPAFWLILAGGIGCQFPFFFFTAHWILHLRGAGISPADAAWAMGLFTLAGIGGRLIGGWMMDKMAARYAFMIGLCCYVIGSTLAMRVNPHALQIAFLAAMFYGMGFGWTFVCANTVTGHFYGPAAFPKVNGMMLLVTGLVCSPAGVIGGKLFDRFGSYKLAFELNILLSLVGITALAFATMPRPATRLRAAQPETA
ncbi:MAG: MFS transporter [Acidobacteriia bacterium]|nr:MFS transporter [Terriglobia bacterium]